jgi:hypothetical protein
MKIELNFFLNNLLFLFVKTQKKKKKDNIQMAKKRIDTHLLYTCKYFQIIYF